jgi:hypothetical protein
MINKFGVTEKGTCNESSTILPFDLFASGIGSRGARCSVNVVQFLLDHPDIVSVHNISELFKHLLHRFHGARRQNPREDNF